MTDFGKAKMNCCMQLTCCRKTAPSGVRVSYFMKGCGGMPKSRHTEVGMIAAVKQMEAWDRAEYCSKEYSGRQR